MAWYDSNWPKRRKVTVDSTQVGADLTDFPVYVDISGIGISNADGIRVTKADGTTEVPREVVSANQLHFKADGTLSSSTDTEFYIYYGNSGASDYAIDATYGAENAWMTDLIGVWHMGEDPSGTPPQIIDSTSNDNDGDSSGSMTSSDSVSGQIENGLDFDGSDDAVIVPYASANDYAGEFMISAWINVDSFASDNTIAARASGGSGEPLFWVDSGNSDISFLVNLTTTSVRIDLTDGLNTDQWYHIVGWYSDTAGEARVYKDGVEAGTDPGAGITNTQKDFYIGNTNSSRPFDGQIDEVRLYDNTKSADWVSAEYTNISTPTSFYTVGSEETETTLGLTGITAIKGAVNINM